MSEPAASRPSTSSPRSPECGGDTDRRTNPDARSSHTAWSAPRISSAGSASTSLSSWDMVRPYTPHSRFSSEAVGLISARSARERVDLLTPLRSANSPRDQPRSARSAASRTPRRVSTGSRPGSSHLIFGTLSHIREAVLSPGNGSERVQHRTDEGVLLRSPPHGREDPARRGDPVHRSYDDPGEVHPDQRRTRYQRHPRARRRQ